MYINGKKVMQFIKTDAVNVDESLSETSENAVQNKVVTENINNLQNQITENKNEIKDLTSVNYATQPSGIYSEGRVYYFKFKNIVIVQFASVVFTSSAISGMGANNTTTIVSGLPKATYLTDQPVILTNLLSENGKVVRVCKGREDKNIYGWWDAPTADEKYTGILVYKCE